MLFVCALYDVYIVAISPVAVSLCIWEEQEVASSRVVLTTN